MRRTTWGHPSERVAKKGLAPKAQKSLASRISFEPLKHVESTWNTECCISHGKKILVHEISSRDFNTNKSLGEISLIVSHAVLELYQELFSMTELACCAALSFARCCSRLRRCARAPCFNPSRCLSAPSHAIAMHIVTSKEHCLRAHLRVAQSDQAQKIRATTGKALLA